MLLYQRPPESGVKIPGRPAHHRWLQNRLDGPSWRTIQKNGQGLARSSVVRRCRVRHPSSRVVRGPEARAARLADREQALYPQPVITRAAAAVCRWPTVPPSLVRVRSDPRCPREYTLLEISRRRAAGIPLPAPSRYSGVAPGGVRSCFVKPGYIPANIGHPLRHPTARAR